jgi:hypothetical protein
LSSTAAVSFWGSTLLHEVSNILHGLVYFSGLFSFLNLLLRICHVQQLLWTVCHVNTLRVSVWSCRSVSQQQLCATQTNTHTHTHTHTHTSNKHCIDIAHYSEHTSDKVLEPQQKFRRTINVLTAPFWLKLSISFFPGYSPLNCLMQSLGNKYPVSFNQ